MNVSVLPLDMGLNYINNNLINFNKYQNIFNIYNQINYFQLNSYDFPKIFEFQFFIKRILDYAYDNWDEKFWYQQSLKLEPK